MTFRTFEVFGMYNNAPTTLMQVLQRTASGWGVIPGAKVLVTTVSNEGFGLSGTPGRWGEFYANRSPTEFGLDADKGVMHMDAQQRRPFVVPGQQLSEIFGPSWRTVVFT